MKQSNIHQYVCEMVDDGTVNYDGKKLYQADEYKDKVEFSGLYK